MRRKCRTCGAPLESNKCDYCGSIHGANKKGLESEPSTADLNENLPSYETPISSSYQDIQDDDNMGFPEGEKRKLAINSVAGAFAVVNVFTLGALWIAIINLAITEGRGMPVTDMHFGILGLTYLLAFTFVIVALILHIVGSVKSKKVEIMTTGHTLGIIACSISLISLLFLSFVSIILFIIAIPFTFAQKNIDWQ